MFAIDTGIAMPFHPDLPRDRIFDMHEFYPQQDAIPDDNSTDISGGHGTHVAGTIGGSPTLTTTKAWQGHAPKVSFNIYKL